MKLVLIEPVDAFLKVNGRVIYGIAEYDDHLLAAHKVAAELAKQSKLKLSDFRYSLIDKSGFFGMTYSVNARDIEDRKVTSAIDAFKDDMQNAAGFMAIELMSGNDLDCYHRFEDIDAQEYEKLITGVAGAMALEDVF